jgi:hypothetical protein
MNEKIFFYRRKKMKFREKLLILFVAVILSILGFYLISSSFVDLHMLAKEAETETVESYHAKYNGSKFL